MRVRLLALIGCVLACWTLARADEPQPPKPPIELDKLKGCVGDWDCVVKYGKEEMKGSATYKVGYGGFWLVEDFKGEGGMFEGRGTTGYDPIKKKYVSTWIDSESPVMMTMQG